MIGWCVAWVQLYVCTLYVLEFDVDYQIELPALPDSVPYRRQKVGAQEAPTPPLNLNK